MMAVINADTGKVVATPAIGEGVDAARFDPSNQLVFSSNGDGTLTVTHEDARDKYSVIDNVQTERGARTMELDNKTHRIYTVTANLAFSPTNPMSRLDGAWNLQAINLRQGSRPMGGFVRRS